MLDKNLVKITICFSILILALAICKPVSAKEAKMIPPPNYLIEQALVTVNCSEATLTTVISLMATNDTLIHYPSGVNMIDPNFLLCESIFVSAAPMGSSLVYIFNTTNIADATTYANAITPSVSTAFGLSFTYYGAGPSDGGTNVTYVAPALGISVLSYYNSVLNPSCLKPDLAGFSNAIPNLLNLHPSQSYAGISAHKTSGIYDWQYIFFAGYFNIAIPTGAGYTLNILNLIGATSLTPSSYASVYAYYMSTVAVYVEPWTTATFVSCNPANISMQYMTRGWYVFPPDLLLDTLTGIFYFGNDTTSVTLLTFTFSGTIIPEFPSFLILPLFVVVTALAVAFAKRELPT
jgi:hypothetical protein